MKSTIKIGRDSSNDIEINEPRISRNHAIITDLGNGTYEIKDLGSTNGTFVNGERITQKIIFPDDKVEVATCLVNWQPAFSKTEFTQLSSTIQEEPFAKIRKTISIGSSVENDIILSESFVSSYHANISILKNGDYYIQDLSSSNGTYVNGTRVMTKNFTKTDVVKIASVDLPQSWFKHKNLRSNVFKDHKKTWIVMLSILVIIAGSALCYLNRCNWFDYGCNLSAEQIYLQNKNSLVHIVHDYYYKIEFQDKTYFVGKNIIFNVTEANTSKENLLPYGTISGSGCFIREDGTILTSAFIVNPWLNESEKKEMVEEVNASKTIEHFSLNQDCNICGETAELQWLANGLVNNAQNYIAATSVISCTLTDSSSVIIRSVKNTLPENTKIVDLFFDSTNENHLNKTSSYYYSAKNLAKPNSLLLDTFYSANDYFNINEMNSAPLNKKLNKLDEGSIVLNERGELVGNVQKHKIVFIHSYYKQIKNH